MTTFATDKYTILMTKILIIFIAIISIISCNTSKETSINTVKENKNANSNPKKSKFNSQARDANLIKLGFDFVAFGNEPFWTLRIDFDKKYAELERLGEQSIIFNTNNDGNNNIEEIEYLGAPNELIVKAIEKPCQDNMSGEGFTYQLHIIINAEEMSGCGKYLGEASSISSINTDIYGTWMLRSINDTILGQESNVRLNIDRKNRIGGYSSCNSFGGNYKLNKDNISFGEIIQTQMYCPASIENAYMSALKNSSKYKIEDNNLKLYDKNNNLLMTFSR